jgi:hypothetical protein
VFLQQLPPRQVAAGSLLAGLSFSDPRSNCGPPFPAGRVQEAEVTHPMKAARQSVLQQQIKELRTGDCSTFLFTPL